MTHIFHELSNIFPEQNLSFIMENYFYEKRERKKKKLTFLDPGEGKSRLPFKFPLCCCSQDSINVGSKAPDRFPNSDIITITAFCK